MEVGTERWGNWAETVDVRQQDGVETRMSVVFDYAREVDYKKCAR